MRALRAIIRRPLLALAATGLVAVVHGQGQPAAPPKDAPPVVAPPVVPQPPKQKAPSGSVVQDTGNTTSASGQFRILGPNITMRRAYAAEAEQVKADFLRLLRLEDRWRHAIVIQLYDPATVSRAGPSVRTSLQAVGNNTFRFQIDVRQDENARPDILDEAVLRCLLGAEVVGSRRADEVRDGDLVPAWLVEGLAEAIQFRRDPEHSAMAAVVFARGRAFPVERLLNEQPDRLSAVTTAAYRASACGLILTLLGQENGPTAFRRMLGDLAEYNGSQGDLIRYHFQALAATDSGIEKWWALQVVDMARPKALDFLVAEESARRLTQALVVDALPESGEGVHQPTDLRQILARPASAEKQRALGTIWNRLHALEPVIHPLYRELVAAYAGLVLQVKEGKAGKPDKITADLEALDAVRAKYISLLDQIDDHLNWWEATQGQGDPKLFEAYRRWSRPADPAPRPDDPIGQYLDEVEKVVK